MATYDLGDVVYLSWNTVNSSGAAQNPGTVTLSVSLPDATTVSITTSTAVTGTYTGSYQPTQAGRHVYAWAATGSWPQALNDVFEVRAVGDIGIVSLDDVKRYISYPTSVITDDDELYRFIDAGIELAQNYCGFNFGRQTITNEVYDGNVQIIRLRQPKAISITSVVEGSTTLSASDYYIDYTGQRLYRIGAANYGWSSTYGWWAAGVQNITVTYVSGFVKDPAVARQGVLELVKHLWESQRGAKSVLGKGSDDYSPSVTFSMPRRVAELLDSIAFPGII